MDVDEQNSIRDKLLQHVERLENLKPEDDFVDILEQLNALLISADRRDVQHIAGKLDLSRLFHRFNTLPNEMFCDELVRVFRMFMEALSLNDLFVKYHQQILEGLQSSNLSIVELWMRKVVKPLFTNEGLLKNIGNSSVSVRPILKTVIGLLLSKDTSVASAAHDICVIAAKTFREQFFSPEIQDELKRVKETKFESKKEQDLFLIRFYELCIDICCVNEQLLDQMKLNGFLNDIIENSIQMLNHDPLTAVNVVKILTDLASKPHGLEYLRNSTSLLPFIAQKIEQVNEEDLFGSLVLPGYINFFIKMAQSDLTILKQYPSLIDKLTSYCRQKQHGNRELQVLAIESVAFLCRTSEGKVFMGDKMDIFLELISLMINSGHNDLKARALSALNEIMEIQGADPGNKAAELTESWYRQLDGLGCGLDRFMQLVLEPFLDVRIPALNFIRILATTLWGQKILAEHTGFLDYLLDRNTETTKEGREAKYEIARELAMSPFIRLSFPPEAHLRIRGYFKEGPIHKEASVAFENS